MLIVDKRHVVEPVKKCIYCGTLVYNADGGALHEEHVIPFALGGQLVLPQASCQACERIINKDIEQPILQSMFKNIRYMAGMPSRRKSSANNPEVDVTHVINHQPVASKVKVEDAVAPYYTFVLKAFDFGAVPIEERDIFEKVHFDMMHGRESPRRGSARYQIAWKDGDVERFGKFLAKIAHGFAYSSGECEKHGLEPILPALIIGKPSPFPLSYVVGSSIDPTKHHPRGGKGFTHNLENNIHHTGKGLKGLITNITLFANIGFPSYSIVTALEPGWRLRSDFY